MNSKYKLIGLDMDGTLLTSDKEILPDTLESLEKAAAAGKYISLSTGRGLAELADYEQALSSVRYGILVSGAVIYDLKENRIIHSSYMDQDLVRQIMEVGREEKAMMYFLADGKSIVQKEQVTHMADFHMGIYQEMYDRIATPYDSLEDAYLQAKNFEKVNLYCRTEESRRRCFERLRALPLQLTYSEETSLETVAEGISKASGLKHLCEYLHIDLAETIVVGDAPNDLEALKTAGFAVAMGNAAAKVKAVCDAAVSDNDHNGAGEAILKYLLQ